MLFKNYFQIIFIIFATTISLLIATFIWDLIHLKISNIEQLGRGQYIEKNYNQSNETLRYLTFILLPLITFLTLMIYTKKIFLKEFFLQLQLTNNKYVIENRFNFFLKLIFLLLLIFEFFSLDFSLRGLDLLHEGQKLSAAYNNFINDKLWSGSFLTIGLFVEIINTRLSWELFEHESIGLMRISITFYVLLCKLFLILIAYKISIISNLRYIYKEFFFIVLSLVLVSLIEYDIERLNFKNIIFRELPILIFSYVFIDYLIDRSKIFKSVILISPLSVFSILFSLDRGIILNILIIFFIIFLLINKKIKHSIIFLISILICWFITYILLIDEFSFFIKNSLYIITEIGYVNGLIHPTPFSSQPGAMRATKTLIFILLSLIISFYLFSKKDDFFPNNLKIVLLFFSILSFLSYAYALGRTDVHHIRESFGFPVIFISIFVFFLLLRYFSNKDFKSLKSKHAKLILTVLMVLLPFSIIDLDLSKVQNFKSRLMNYIYLNDEVFLKKDHKKFVNNVKNIISENDCFQNFTDDVALNYLLKKKNCSIYYMVYSLGSKKTQKELINSLEKTEIIIAYQERLNNDDIKERPNYKLWKVNEYIKKNYKIIFNQDDKIVLKKLND